MRSLEHSLEDHELIVLRVIAEWWELDLTGADKQASVKALAERLAQVDMQQEMMFLPPEEAAALRELVAQGGRLPVATFAREHGEVRLMGPGRMEREEPWLAPVSAAEALWYRGFLYRGFDETEEGVLEFYYLPQELLEQFPQTQRVAESDTAVTTLQATSPPGNVQTAVTDAVEDLTTLLALALKTALRPEALNKLDVLLLNPERNRRSLLLTLAEEMELVYRSNGAIRPTRAAVAWLKQSRDAQLQALAEAWTNSDWNDLWHTPGLVCEGQGWQNDPMLARTALLDALPRDERWYRLADLVEHVKQIDPDFQRPDGNYDTWYVREANQEAYLTGFAAWDAVEGRLLRFLVQGPLFWLGMVETAAEGQPDVSAYRLTGRALTWLGGDTAAQEEVRVPLFVQPDGTLIVPQTASRYQRFRAARVAEMQPVEAGKPFTYRLTPQSLSAAQDQGITPDRVLEFLRQASNDNVPKSVERGVVRWSERGVEGRLETAVVLRVGDAAILDTLRNNPKTRDFIGESLGDFAVTIRRESWEEFRAATAQLGLLLDVDA